MDSNLSRLYFMLGNYDDEDVSANVGPEDSSEDPKLPLSDQTVTGSSTQKDTQKSRGICTENSTTKLPLESDTLLLNSTGSTENAISTAHHQAVPSSVVFVELPPPKGVSANSRQIPSLLDSPPAATLDISSSTTINATSGPGGLLQQTSNDINKNSSNIPPNKPPLVELHFNPLYTITIEDIGGEQVISRRVNNSNNYPPHSQPPLPLPPPHSPRGRGEHFHHHLRQRPHSNANEHSHQQHLLFGQTQPFELSLPPTDHFGFIYLSLLLAGIGFLLPYNCFVLAGDYFQHRYPEKAELVVFDMSTTYIVVALCTVVLSNAAVEAVPLFWRLNAGFLLSFAVMATVAGYEVWESLGGYFPNLVLVGVASIGCTLQQATFYGYTSMLPQKYTQAVMTGESAAGIFVSLNRILTKMLYPKDEQLNTTLFFLVAIFLIVICSLLHALVLPRSAFIRYYVHLCNSSNTAGHAQSLHSLHSEGGHIVASSPRAAAISTGPEDGRHSARSMLRRINENLGLVQMYEHREQQQIAQAEVGGHTSGQRRYTSTFSSTSARPSIYSTTSSHQLHLDGMIESGNSGNGLFRSRAANVATSNNNVKVASILRTDSMECVLPFGIDDEELANSSALVEESPEGGVGFGRGPRRARGREAGDLDDVLVPEVEVHHHLEHQDSSTTFGSTSGSSDFKTKSATSAFVTFLSWSETFITRVFRVVGILARRLRRCVNSFKGATSSSGTSSLSSSRSLRRKLQLRKVILERTWPHITSILLVYFVTLILFPGIEWEIATQSGHCGQHLLLAPEWMPILLMALFNVTDFTGKLLSTCFYRITGTQLLTVACARVILVPAMALCVTPRPEPFFAHPLWPIFFTVVLGLTNGIFGSLPMILAPTRVHESLREMTGNLMTFSYIIGLTSGSFASYYLHDWIDLHSPMEGLGGGNFSSINGSFPSVYDNCSDLFNGHGSLQGGDDSPIFDRNALLQSLGNGSFSNVTAELINSVAPELLQNSTAFSASMYHF